MGFLEDLSKGYCPECNKRMRVDRCGFHSGRDYCECGTNYTCYECTECGIAIFIKDKREVEK